MKLLTCYNTAIYLRLSRDDKDGNLESNSIANQRMLLTDYVKEKGWNIAGIYVDDGFTGTNFNRPDFQRLLQDIENGIINCVITKDLSRFGRNYSMVGYYTEEYFPQKGVRYIAINGDFDSAQENNDLAAFNNVINELYPKQISRKVRQVKRSNAAKGMFMNSQAPYGYMKAPNDKHQLIIDEEAARIVKRIFTEYARGENASRIADRLNYDGVLCPRAYYYAKQGKINPKNETALWGSRTIMEILRKQTYIGNLVQGQREVISFKSKQRRTIPPDEWVVVEGTHEPIINQDLWNEVQKALTNKAIIRTPKIDRELATFTGLLFCADCHSIMSGSLRGNKGKEKMSYRCSKYTAYGKGVCTSHNIREEILEAIVLQDIHQYAKLAISDKKQLVSDLLSYLKVNNQSESKIQAKELEALNRKVAEINNTIKSLYADKVTGKMSENIFFHLLPDYERELEETNSRIQALQTKLLKTKSKESDIVKWVNMIEKYAKITSIDRYLARELIDKIIVSDNKKVNGESIQEITIYYKLVGQLPVSLKEELKNAG